MGEFIVSARKYRPASFASVVGQGHITQTLQAAIAKGQLAHAYLFTGPRGVGKTTCARIFAKAINCENLTETSEPCEICESCVSFNKSRSWNVHELDGASNNSVEDIRLLIEKVRVAPQSGRYSVYIIDEVHMLSAAAFNAFLKTLEEPPKHAVFILATTEKHKILPTILSRCQCFDFKRIQVGDIVQYLKYVAQKEEIRYDEQSLDIIAMKADGGMRDALSTFDRVVAFSEGVLDAKKTAECVGALDFSIYFKAIEDAREGRFEELLNVLNDVVNNGFDPSLLIGGLAEHLRNLLVAKNESTISLLDASEATKTMYRSQAKLCDVEWILSAMNLISTADAGYRTAVNKRLHCELALIKLCGLKKKDDGLISEGEDEKFALPDLRGVKSAVGGSEKVGTTVGGVGKSVERVEIATSVVEKPVLSQPVSEPQSAQPIATPSAETPKPRTKVRLTPSINTIVETDISKQAAKIASEEGFTPDVRPVLTLNEAVDRLRSNWLQVVTFWHSKGKVIIATALTNFNITDDRVIIMVANLSVKDEILAHKQEIEMSIKQVLNVRATIEVVVSDAPQSTKPRTLEQIFNFMAAKNKRLLKIKEDFDLTI